MQEVGFLFIILMVNVENDVNKTVTQVKSMNGVDLLEVDRDQLKLKEVGFRRKTLRQDA